jgi:hypothetical protein
MRISRYAALLLGVGLLAACGGPAPRSGGVEATRAGATVQTATTTSLTVPLVTGGQAQIVGSADGQPSVSVKPAVVDGKITNSAAATFDVGGDVYAVPGDALPYFGTLLDPRLFDISYLARAGYSTAKALPVTITWRKRAHSAVPGVTSAASGITTAGTISKAASFGAELAAGQRDKTGALSQIKRISLAAEHGSAQTAAPAVTLNSTGTTAGKLYALTVTPYGRDGQLSDAIVVIQNTHSTNTYYSVTDLVLGGQEQVAVSVPAGQYAIEGYVYDYDSIGLLGAVSLVTTQVTVGSDTQVSLDASTAKPVTATVPDSGAAPQMAQLTMARASADGTVISGGLQVYGPGTASSVSPVQLYATPAAKPSAGILGFADSWVFVPAGTGFASPDVPDSYFLNFADDSGIPSGLSHDVTASELATVHSSFSGEVSGDGDMFQVTPYDSWLPVSTYLYPDWLPYPAPTERTDYYYGTPGTVWRQLAETVEAPIANALVVGALEGPYVAYHPGEVTSVTWGGGPAVPVPQWQDMGVTSGLTGGGISTGDADLSFPCTACREGQIMSFEAQEADSDPRHWDPVFGYGTGILSSTTAGQGTDELKFYANGVLTQVGDYSGQTFPLLPGTARYELDWTSTRSGWSDLGTSVTSDWTFTSGSAKASKLPSYEYCSPSPLTSCDYLPLVFASYDFGDGDQGQVTAPGKETFTVTGFHQVGENAPAVTHATVQVSFDDGGTWTTEPVTSLGGGRFRVTVTQPGTSGFASVRVTLTDGGGDALRQTIIHAWELVTSQGPGSEGR